MRTCLAIMVCCMLPFMVGCQSSDYSKNMRAATAQSSATVSVKLLLDEVAMEKYDSTKKLTIEVAGDVSRFLDTGKIGDLPIDAARDAVVKYMEAKGWTQYVPMVIAVFDIVAAQTVPVEKLGADNIAIIKLGFDAAVTSANTSKIEWRRPPPNTKTAVRRRGRSWQGNE